ncbi:hypothetical protein MCCARTNEY_205 [Bacillus phage vB_BanH_McCartney]|nr:hypothetical protein MCCARTNEY_205 [Bacillus phage vB_BanH_McCartney]
MFTKEIIVDGKWVKGKFVQGSVKSAPFLFRVSSLPEPTMGVQALDNLIGELQQVRDKLKAENELAVKEQLVEGC